VSQPYRNDLEGLHRRIETLENALRERVCEECSARRMSRRRRTHRFLAWAVGVVVWAGLFFTYACCSAYFN
jgi:hypothetical protein